MSTAFDDEQFERNYPPGIENNFWHRCRNRIILAALREHTQSGLIAEIGCGKGTTTSFLKRSGCNIIGIEPGNPHINDEQKTYVYTATTPENLDPAMQNTVKTMLLLDVIEHIDEPEEFIRRMLHIFPRASHIVFTVPARKELWSSFDDINGHKRRYDMKLLAQTCAAAGLRVVHMRYFFHTLALAIIVKRKLFKHNVESPMPPRRPIVHACIAWLCHLEHLILPKQCIGSSIICVASRNL